MSLDGLDMRSLPLVGDLTLTWGSARICPALLDTSIMFDPEVSDLTSDLLVPLPEMRAVWVRSVARPLVLGFEQFPLEISYLVTGGSVSLDEFGHGSPGKWWAPRGSNP